MKVKIVRPTIAQKRQVMPGEVLDVSKEEAVQLIGANKAVIAKEIAVETTSISTAAVESSAIEPAQTVVSVETEEKPARGKKKASA